MRAALPILVNLGFGTAGSIAACVQAMIGNVVAGGIFATLQSAAVLGYGVARVVGVIRIICVLVIALVLYQICA
ncbi:hypothetical protein F5X97DRAFT_302111 [Nemania serpens]|nr:hypothetical protein F5X97DRAFT_302111 [Nemania serpens]